MTRDVATEAFLRWRDQDDVDALGRAFDLCSPRLFARALALERNHAEAEDLVQTVFLEAMRRAERLDPTRALLPWLAGMLDRAARARRRSWRRRLRREHRAASDPTVRPEDTERTESVALVQQALDRLPEAEREVVRLRHVAGLDVRTVAQTLDIPEGTVKSRTKRGVSLMRAALPAGIASSILLLLSPQGLAAMRARLLAKACRATLRPAAAVSPLAATALLLAFFAPLFWWVFLHEAPTGSMPTRFEPGRTEEGSLLETEAPRAPDPSTPPERGEPASATRDDRRSPRPRWDLSGIVVLGDSPLPGAEVQLDWLEASGRGALGRVTTDGDGRFTFDLEALRTWPPVVRRLATLHATAWHPAQGHAAAAFVEDVPPRADESFSRAITLRISGEDRLIGRVVSPSGAPQADVFVGLRSPELPRTAHFAFTAVTDTRGRFTLPILRGKEVWLIADHAALGRARRDLGTLTGPGPIALQDIVLDEGSRVEGMVRRPNGRSAAGRALWLVAAGGGQDRSGLAPLRLRTDANGSFGFRGVPRGQYRLELEGPAPHHPRLLAARFEVNARHVVRDLVDPRPELTVRCTEPSGWPLRGLELRITKEGPDSVSWIVDHGDANGLYHCPLPVAGRYRCSLAAPGCITQEEPLEIGEGESITRVFVVHPASDQGRLRIHLRDADDRPVDDLSITVFAPRANHFVESPLFELEAAHDQPISLPVGRYRLLVVPARNDDPLVAMATKPAIIDVEITPAQGRQILLRTERRARVVWTWPPYMSPTDSPTSLAISAFLSNSDAESRREHSADLFRWTAEGPRRERLWSPGETVHWFPPPALVGQPLTLRVTLGKRTHELEARIAPGTVTHLPLDE